MLGGLDHRRRAERTPNRSRVLAVAMMGAGASSFTGALLFGSLPAIAEDLHTTTSVISWLGIAPAIAFAVSMPLFGKLGDHYGHRRVFIAGWAVAAVLSFGAAAAPNAGVLILLRTAGALAGTSTSPAAYGVLARIYEPHERAGPYSKVTVALAVSPIIGVSVGGPLVDAVGWRVMFIGQGAVSIVAVLFAMAMLPETPRRVGVRFDVAGVLALAIGLTSCLLAVNRWRAWGIHHVGLLALAIVGPAALVIFAMIERNASDPLLSPAMLRNRAVTSAMGTSLFVNAGFNGLDVLTPFAARALFGWSASTISYVNAARALGFASGAATARRFARNWPGRGVIWLGHALVVGACGVVALGVHSRSRSWFLAGLVVSSLGTGFARPSIATTITNAVRDEDAGVANGANNMAHQIGASIGQTTLIAVGAGGATGDLTWACLLGGCYAACSLVTASFAGARQPEPAVAK